MSTVSGGVSLVATLHLLKPVDEIEYLVLRDFREFLAQTQSLHDDCGTKMNEKRETG